MKKTLTALVILILTASPAAADTSLSVVGHRGHETTLSATENSRAAIKSAMQSGANGVEVDVRLTKDGKQIVMHDATVNRTSSCFGSVTMLTYEALRACKLNSGEKVPNLYEAAWEFSKWDSKTDKFWIHVKFNPTAKQRKSLFKAVDKYGLRKQTVILADEDDTLDAFRKWSGIERALIFNATDVAQGGRESWEAGFDYAVPYDVPVTPQLVSLARKAGSKVYGIESHPLSLAQAEDLGLDGFIANDVLGAVAL